MASFPQTYLAINIFICSVIGDGLSYFWCNTSYSCVGSTIDIPPDSTLKIVDMRLRVMDTKVYTVQQHLSTLMLQAMLIAVKSLYSCCDVSMTLWIHMQVEHLLALKYLL